MHRRGERCAVGVRDPDDHSGDLGVVAPRDDRTEHRRTVGQGRPSDELRHVGGRAGELGDAAHRREPERRAVGQFALRRPARVPARQGLHLADPRIGDHDDATPVSGGPRERRGGEPAPQRLLARSQVGSREQCPPVEQHDRGIAGVGDRLGAGRGDDEGRLVRHRGENRTASTRAHCDTGERPAELLGRARGADDRRPQPLPRTLGTSPVRRRTPTPSAGRDGLRGSDSQRTGALRADAAGPAARARERGHVARPRRLDEHWVAGGHTVTQGAPGPRGKPRGARRGVPRQVGVVADGGDPGRGRADDLAGGLQRMGPATGHERVRLRRTRMATQQHGGPGEVGPQQRNVAGVGVRRAWLGQGVVAVVPHHDQAEVGDRCEHGRARPDDRMNPAAGDREKAAVSLGGLVGRQRRV